MTRARRQATATGEAGFGLIEVVISAAVLLMVTMGTLALIDGTQRTTVQNRSRTAAAALAEQDQERLRSMPVTSLANDYTETRNPVTVGGVDYKVTSDAQWMRDANAGPITCTNETGQAEYLQIRSTADAVSNDGVAPVTITSLLTPQVGTLADRGSYTFQLNDRNGVGLAGIPVQLTGPQSTTETTNSAGCAVFDYLKTGSYTANVGVAGYVTPLASPTISTSAVISSGKLNASTPQLYDRAASLNVSVARTSDGSPSTAEGVTVGNPGIGNADSTLSFRAPGGAATSPISATGLFPFKYDATTKSYSVYSGTCSVNAPDKYGATTQTVNVDPGGTYNVTVKQPTLTVAVQKSGSALKNTTVHLVATVNSSSCASQDTYGITGTTDSSGRLSMDLPWGPYTLCADFLNGTTRWSKSGVTTTNTSPAGTMPTVNVAASGAACKE